MKIIIDMPSKELTELATKKIIEGVSEAGKKEYQLSDGEVGERTYSLDFETLEEAQAALKEDE